jgi:hypothetical protein
MLSNIIYPTILRSYFKTGVETWRECDRLSALAVKRLSTPGYHPDGRNLYLQVSESGSKSWIFRYTVNGKERHMGLGSYPDVSLAHARADATEQRLIRKSGKDPLEVRRSQRLSDQRQPPVSD